MLEAGVPLTTFRVQDPELRRPCGEPVPAATDRHGRPLPDDVPPEADPRSASELQAESRGLRHGAGKPCVQARRLQDEEQRLGPTRERSQPAEPLRDAGRPGRNGGVPPRREGPRDAAGREVHDEEIHGPAGQERARDGEALVQVRRRDDHQPIRRDAPGAGLHRIEAPGEVQPGHDQPGRLGLCRDPQRERGGAA